MLRLKRIEDGTGGRMMGRLIDADDFFARMENDTDLCAEMEADGLKALKKYLDIQPTAYDVDNVVATMDKALIELEDGTNCGTCVFKEVCDDGYDGCIQTIVAVCKSIVKAGGKNE